MGSLRGKRALITGAGQGIGYATAERLIEAGCDIALHYFTSDEGSKKLAELAKSKGQRASCFQADLTQEEAARRCVAEAVSFLGGLDVLVNNAGIADPMASVEHPDPDAWDAVIGVVVIGTVMSRAFASRIRKGQPLEASS